VSERRHPLARAVERESVNSTALGIKMAASCDAVALMRIRAQAADVWCLTAREDSGEPRERGVPNARSVRVGVLITELAARGPHKSSQQLGPQRADCARWGASAVRPRPAYAKASARPP
jgi:hypothetical protein